MRPNASTLLTLFTLSTLACSGTEAPSSATATGGAPDIQPTGQVHTVLMITDEKGSYYSPSTIEASRGDVVRFTLKSGVHNVSFPDSLNTIKDALPKSSDFLQLPGQEYDLPVSMRPGTYQFHCEPHAALGKKATLNVK
jgi:plastocyanin